MKYGFYDKKARLSGIIEDDLLVTFDKIKSPKIGSIYRTYLGKRLAFLNANEIDLQGQEALIFDKERRGAGSGQILVQLKNHPYDDKKATVTEKIILKGRYIILDPYFKGLNISKKITDKDIRKNFQDNFPLRQFGTVIRTSAQGKFDEATEEYKYFTSLTDEIFSKKDFKPCPYLIYEPVFDFSFEYKDLDRIYTNDLSLYKKLKSVDLIYDKSFSYTDDKVIMENLMDAEKRRIEVAGAELVIDELEALTVIDVNSKKIKRGSSKSENADYVNNLLIEKILSQLVIRNIGGIVIIDFIRSNKKNMEDLLKSVKLTSKKFSLSITSISYTQSGLMEIVLAR